MFDVCAKYGVPPALMVALMSVESGFNPNAISATDDYGLCQINKGNHAWLSQALGVTNFLDPKQNILCGVYILQSHIKNYGTTNQGLHKSLMAYNMGAGGASKLWATGKYTSAYSIKVMTAYDKYR